MQQHPTAEGVLARLWQDRQDDAAPQPADPARVRQLAQVFGEQAMQCVADRIGARHADLVQDSADMLESLFSLWAACGLSPGEIWSELHKREQLGSLLVQINRPKRRAPRRLLKPWRVASTKLP